MRANTATTNPTIPTISVIVASTSTAALSVYRAGGFSFSKPTSQSSSIFGSNPFIPYRGGSLGNRGLEIQYLEDPFERHHRGHDISNTRHEVRGRDSFEKWTAPSCRGAAWGTMQYAAEEPARVELDAEVESGE